MDILESEISKPLSSGPLSSFKINFSGEFSEVTENSNSTLFPII
ncbi:MAG: hypothetical protein ACD_79C00801G0001 [uncultured bacterium]|nr:MAG: hypothetical protein ACD_79C00801G0001 [uncultured bacterium]